MVTDKDSLYDTELDKRIWAVNGMAYHMKDEFISKETQEALDAYQEAREKQIPWKIKHYGKLHTELVIKDYKNAVIKLKAEGK